MTKLNLDFAIVGDSLAGAAAVEYLASRGFTGAWLDDGQDSGGLDNLASVVEANGSSRISGAVFRERLLDSVRHNPLRDGVATQVEEDGVGVRVLTFRGEVLTPRRVIAAPFGTEIDPPPRLGLEAFYGIGVSNDAAADTSFFKKLPVIVWGSGYRAAEQALIAVRSSSAVTVVSDAEIDFGDLAHEMAAHPKIILRRCQSISEISSNEDGSLAGLLLETADGPKKVSGRAIFLARELKFSAGIYGGGQKFQQLVRSGRAIPAGMAAGVSHRERSKSVASGRKAATTLLSAL